MISCSALLRNTAMAEKQYSEYVLPPSPPLNFPLPLLLQYIYLTNFDHVPGKQVTLRHVFHDLISWTLKRKKKIAPIENFPLYCTHHITRIQMR